jgi:hypothetical protein
MRKIVSAVAAVIALLSVPLVAWAGPPTQTTANGTLLSHQQTLVRSADSNLTFNAVDTVAFTGGIDGTVTDTYTFTVHPDGSINGHGIETCGACTIGGRSGAYTEVFSFTATANFATFEGTFTLLTSSGGLSGLRGQGTFQGGGFSETIRLNYQFEPSA